MAFQNMIAELRGIVPKLPVSYARTLINRAYADIRRQNLWSFQVYEANWISPAVVTGGVATPVQGNPVVTLDATATAALNASATTYNPINQRQFRQGISTVCNIINWDSAGHLTLDRGYPDPAGITGPNYIIYQSYYPAPFIDHLSFVSVRDMVNFTDLILEKDEMWLNEQDPQRTWYYFPTHVIPYLVSTNNPNNLATYNFMMFELWGVPQTNRAYQLYGIRKGLDLVNPTDTIPQAITEETVVAMAKYYAFEWAMANSGNLPRNQGPDWRFLMGETKARYTELFRKQRQQDRELIDNWFKVRRSALFGKYFALYNSISGTAYPGAFLG